MTPRTRDKCIGAYLGAAIGDAMGGPVESSHFRRIRRTVGEVRGLLPYDATTMLQERLERPGGPFYPGYALHGEPGSITDDTFCRKDMANFIIENPASRTPEKLAGWLLDNAALETQWPQIMIPVLERIRAGEVTASEAGDTAKQGGGIGWWFPFGIIHAANPVAAADEARRLCAIWKAPLERDFVAAVVAGIAEALKKDATWETVRDGMLAQCGPLATQLLERAIRIAGEAEDTWDLARRLYDEALMSETAHIWEITPDDPPTAADAPIPPRHAPLEDSDESYTTFFFAEQIPLALAAFIFAKGAVEAIPVCVNLGRDCDTTATTVGALVGALHGESALPRDWVETVCTANRQEIDLREQAEQLVDVQ
jgi:ADP-ribosylglycohydrolase